MKGKSPVGPVGSIPNFGITGQAPPRKIVGGPSGGLAGAVEVKAFISSAVSKQ
jgi:hypothetical protein